MGIEVTQIITEENFRRFTFSAIGGIATTMPPLDIPPVTARIQFLDSDREDLIAYDSLELAEKSSGVIDLKPLTREEKQQAITIVFEAAAKGEVWGLKIPKEAVAYIFSEKYHPL